MVTSLQITWECLRKEMYLPNLTVFRRERISVVVYSKCIGLRSLDGIKCTRLTHFFFFLLLLLLLLILRTLPSLVVAALHF